MAKWKEWVDENGVKRMHMSVDETGTLTENGEEPVGITRPAKYMHNYQRTDLDRKLDDINHLVRIANNKLQTAEKNLKTAVDRNDSVAQDHFSELRHGALRQLKLYAEQKKDAEIWWSERPVREAAVNAKREAWLKSLPPEGLAKFRAMERNQQRFAQMSDEEIEAEAKSSKQGQSVLDAQIYAERMAVEQPLTEKDLEDSRIRMMFASTMALLKEKEDPTQIDFREPPVEKKSLAHDFLHLLWKHGWPVEKLIRNKEFSVAVAEKIGKDGKS